MKKVTQKKPKPMSALLRFYVKPCDLGEKLPDGVEANMFVKCSGDTVGVVHVMTAGGFGLWRNGCCIGTFDSLLEVYRKLDQLGE